VGAWFVGASLRLPRPRSVGRREDGRPGVRLPRGWWSYAAASGRRAFGQEWARRPLILSQLWSMDFRVRHAQRLISEDLRRPLMLEEVARAVNLSPPRLRYLFKAETDMTPAQYQKSLRM
jgi:hypothetical protein